jgi:glucokinase
VFVDNLAIGVDIGGTKIAVAAVDSAGSVKACKRFLTDIRNDPKVIVEDIAAAVEGLQQEIGQKFLGVGIGMAGQIDPQDGTVLFAPNLQWRTVPLKDLLYQKLNLPVFITNDVRAAALGEWLYGAGRGCQDLVCLLIGTGIGGGIISGGHLLTGVSNTAGELGHITLVLDGPVCTCGNLGCLEALASGWAIEKMAREKIAQDQRAGKVILQLAQGELYQVSARQVVEAAEADDPMALQIIQQAIHAIAIGCVSIVNALNPERLILGGGLGLALPNLIPQVGEAVHHYALKAASKPLSIVEAQLGNEAGVIGAACLNFPHQP